MKILLVLPASGDWRGIGKRKVFNGKTFRFSLLSLLSVAALTPPEHEIKIVDEQVDDIPWDEEFDLVGLAVMTATAPRAFEISNIFRGKGVPVVLGGYFPTLNPEEASRHADAVVVGPASGAWERILADLPAGKLQKIYCGQYTKAVPGRLPRHLMGRGKYLTMNAVYATYGCTNKCSFCSIGAYYGGKRYHREVGEVAGEIGEFKEKFFMFVDDNLTQDREYVLRLCRALAPLKKNWVTQASVEIADDDELLREMSAAGCVGIFAGLESFSKAALDSQNKNIKPPEKYREAVRKLHSHGIYVEAGIIFGFDTDTKEAFRNTLKNVEEIGVDIIQVSILTPKPGTKLFEEMKGRIKDFNWEHYDFKYSVFDPARMTSAELEAGAQWVRRTFYSPWHILKRIPRWIMGIKGGFSHFWYPLALNLAYMGRTVSFKLGGYDPAKQRYLDAGSGTPKWVLRRKYTGQV